MKLVTEFDLICDREWLSKLAISQDQKFNQSVHGGTNVPPIQK